MCPEWGILIPQVGVRARAVEWYPLWRCVVLKDPETRGLSRFSGGLSEGETPLPIPNREVKPLSADGTWLARAWESRTPPVSYAHEPPQGAARGVAMAFVTRPIRGSLTTPPHAA